MVELTVFSGQVCACRHLAGVFLLWLRTQELSALMFSEAKHLPELGEELIGQAVSARLSATGRQLESCLKLIKRDALLCTFACLLGI